MSLDEPTVNPPAAAGLEALSSRRLILELVAASFVVLLATFLGLGLGCLRSGRRFPRRAWTLLPLATVAPAGAVGRVVFAREGVSERVPEVALAHARGDAS
jgi:hypothetical protein